MPPIRRYLLIFGGVFVFTSGFGLVRQLTAPDDVWWTPEAMAEPLDACGDRIRVSVGGTPLDELVQAGRVVVTSTAGTTPVAPADIRVRFDNQDRVRVGQLPTLLASAFTLGMALTFVLVGAVGWGPPPKR